MIHSHAFAQTTSAFKVAFKINTYFT